MVPASSHCSMSMQEPSFTVRRMWGYLPEKLLMTRGSQFLEMLV